MTRVARYMMQKYRPASGIEMRLDKRIPVAAGLGGGSSNAANVIKCLNSLWDLRLSDDEMHAVAALHGSDVNYFLVGGACQGNGRGEMISPVQDIAIPHLLLVNPGIPISSREAYSLCGIPQQARTFDPSHHLESCFNRLEEGIRRKYQIVDDVLNRMMELGARVAMLSGSGSTCFAIFDDDNALQKCRAGFPAPLFWTHSTRTLTRDEYQQCFPSLN